MIGGAGRGGMVPSQHSAVRRALSSYSAPTGLRRRRKDVNGPPSPLASPRHPLHVLPTPLFRVLSHVSSLPRLGSAFRSLVLPPRTDSRNPLHSVPLPPAVSGSLLRPRGCNPRVAHARVPPPPPPSDKTLSYRCQNWEKRVEGKGRDRSPNGAGEQRARGRERARRERRCFLKNVCSFCLLLSIYLPHLRHLSSPFPVSTFPSPSILLSCFIPLSRRCIPVSPSTQPPSRSSVSCFCSPLSAPARRFQYRGLMYSCPRVSRNVEARFRNIAAVQPPLVPPRR